MAKEDGILALAADDAGEELGVAHIQAAVGNFKDAVAHQNLQWRGKLREAESKVMCVKLSGTKAGKPWRARCLCQDT